VDTVVTATDLDRHTSK